jgi:thiamine-phosphate pyrophosphorylase
MTSSYKENLKRALKLYFILGSANCMGRSPSKVLSEAIEGGITMFQFREKGTGALTGSEKYGLAEELQNICKKASIPFIVNDDIELALALHADGIHIGQDDEPAQLVRERMKGKILGISVHNMKEAQQAISVGADYFGVGPIFPTSTKEDTNDVQGVKVISEFRTNGITIPIVGIGGITSENAASVIEAGADGVSVITAISQAENVQIAASRIRENISIHGTKIK